MPNIFAVTSNQNIVKRQSYKNIDTCISMDIIYIYIIQGYFIDKHKNIKSSIYFEDQYIQTGE